MAIKTIQQFSSFRNPATNKLIKNLKKKSKYSTTKKIGAIYFIYKDYT